MGNVRGFGASRLLILGSALVLAACSGATTSSTTNSSPANPASPSPVAVPSSLEPSLGPSPIGSPEPTQPTPVVDLTGADEFAFVNRFVMRVAVSDLNVREEPSTSAKSKGKAPKGGLFMF
jgi:uncharacterized protein YgiM (DUF1202 family)